MKRSEQTFPQNKLLCSHIKKFWKMGVFDEYSNEHFLIKAIENDDEYFKNVFIRNRINPKSALDFGFNFIINFNSRLHGLCQKFGEEKIEIFMKDQFSAGKAHYSESAFFEALAEVHVLAHFLFFTNRRVLSAEYEPRLNGDSRCNPEARIEYDEDLIVDIEVKTPKFEPRDILKNALYPAVLLTDKGRQELNAYCRQQKISVQFPRVLKIKEFMNSANEKFSIPQNEKHFNLLFINWSYSDLYENPLFEPLSLFCNRANGLLVDKNIGKKLKIEEDAYEKISAIIIYTIPVETLLFGDFRYLFRDRCYKIIINPYSRYSNSQLLHDLTGMAVHEPKELSCDLTTFFNFERKDWQKELLKIRDIIENNIL